MTSATFSKAAPPFFGRFTRRKTASGVLVITGDIRTNGVDTKKWCGVAPSFTLLQDGGQTRFVITSLSASVRSRSTCSQGVRGE